MHAVCCGKSRQAKSSFRIPPGNDVFTLALARLIHVYGI